jgi:hypothetical protein
MKHLYGLWLATSTEVCICLGPNIRQN